MKLRKAKLKKVDEVEAIKAMVKFYKRMGFNYDAIAEVLGISRQALFNIRRSN